MSTIFISTHLLMALSGTAVFYTAFIHFRNLDEAPTRKLAIRLDDSDTGQGNLTE